jgi:hypothetical protein
LAEEPSVPRKSPVWKRGDGLTADADLRLQFHDVRDTPKSERGSERAGRPLTRRHHGYARIEELGAVQNDADVAHPKRGDTLQLLLMAEFPTDPKPQKLKQASLFDPKEEAAN